MECEIEIIGQVTSSPWGSFSTGDIYRGDKAVCDHLVNECKVAKYREVKQEIKEEVKTTKQNVK